LKIVTVRVVTRRVALRGKKRRRKEARWKAVKKLRRKRGVWCVFARTEGTVNEALLCCHAFHERCLEFWWANCLKNSAEPSCPACRARAVRSAA